MADKPTPNSADHPAAPAGERWRMFASALCIAVAAILVPVSVIAGWARAGLVEESRFVSTFAPLASEPVIQQAISDRVAEAINDAVDLTPVTDDLWDGLTESGLPDAAVKALGILRTQAREGLHSLIRNVSNEVVTSEAFAAVWESTLRASHRALVVGATGGTDSGALVIDDSGTVSIQLEPIVAAVKTALTERGVGIAAVIPTVQATIDLGQSDALVTFRIVVSFAIAIGAWLPIVTVFLLALGITIARRRSTALLGAGIGVALGSVGLSSLFGVGGILLDAAATQLGFSPPVVTLIFTRTIATMSDAAVALTVLGATIAVLAWVHGRWAPAKRIRGFFAALNASIRAALPADWSRVSQVMHRARILIRAVIAGGAALVLWLLRPWEPSEIALVVLISLLVWWVTEMLAATSRTQNTAATVDPSPPATA